MHETRTSYKITPCWWASYALLGTGRSKSLFFSLFWISQSVAWTPHKMLFCMMCAFRAKGLFPRNRAIKATFVCYWLHSNMPISYNVRLTWRKFVITFNRVVLKWLLHLHVWGWGWTGGQNIPFSFPALSLISDFRFLPFLFQIITQFCKSCPILSGFPKPRKILSSPHLLKNSRTSAHPNKGFGDITCFLDSWQ